MLLAKSIGDIWQNLMCLLNEMWHWVGFHLRRPFENINNFTLIWASTMNLWPYNDGYMIYKAWQIVCYVFAMPTYWNCLCIQIENGFLLTNLKIAYCQAWGRHVIKTLSALLTLYEWNLSDTGGLASQRTSKAGLWYFFNVSPNKLLNKESICLWFETPFETSL